MRRAFVSICLALAFGGCAAARAGEPLAIREGWANTPASLTPIIFANKNLLKHYGKSYTLVPMRYAGTSPEITALATGDLDIATMAYSSFAAAIENARMDDLRIVADGFQDGVPGYYSSEYLVLKTGPIHKVEDLKGKVLVSNAIGGAIDMGIREMLRRHHLEGKRDYTVVEARFPAMPAMLEERKADLIGSVPPFDQIAKARGTARVLFTLRDAFGTSDMIFQVARAGWIAKNRAALVDFSEDWLRALRWFIDPANHDAAVRIVSDYTKLKPAVYAGWVFTRDDYYRDPAARPNLVALQHNIDAQQALGFVKRGFDVKKYADLSLIDEAAARLN